MSADANQFERGILLPYGCKDLIDALRLPQAKVADPVRTFIHNALYRAERVRASQVIISAPMVNDADCYVTRRVNFGLYFDTTIAASLRSRVITELLRLAAVPEGQFPAEGVVCLPFTRSRFKWKLEIETANADCVLMPHCET